MIQKRLAPTTKAQVDFVQNVVPIELNLFDIISLAGKDISRERFIDRMQLLQEIVEGIGDPHVKYLPYRTSKFAEHFAVENEGLMLKKLNGIYVRGPTRSHYSWLKAKRTLRKLGLVVGYRVSDSATNRKYFRSLVFVDPVTKEYIGKCGVSSFSETERAQLRKYLDAQPKDRLNWALQQRAGSYIPVQTKLVIPLILQEVSQYGIMYAPRRDPTWQLDLP